MAINLNSQLNERERVLHDLAIFVASFEQLSSECSKNIAEAFAKLESELHYVAYAAGGEAAAAAQKVNEDRISRIKRPLDVV